MKNILISQRVDKHHQGSERRDALDQAWYTLLRELFDDILLIAVTNDLINTKNLLLRVKPELIVLSGGNDLEGIAEEAEAVPEREASENLLVRYAIRHGVPVIAVCRGAQKLNQITGGKLEPIQGHVAKEHKVELVKSKIKALSVTVNSYHHYGITNRCMLGEGLTPIGVCVEDGSVECFVHNQHKWLGLMWHPERKSKCQVQQVEFIADVFRGWGEDLG